MTLINDLTQAIDLQQERQDRDYAEMMQKPLQERVNKGHTLANASIDINFYAGQPNSFCPYLSGNNRFIRSVIVRCDNNISRFREGATVTLGYGNYSFRMIIEEDRLDSMVLVSGDFDVKNNFIDCVSYPRNGWEINEEPTTITKKLLGATRDRISAVPDLCYKMERLLDGSLRNSETSVYLSPSNNASQDQAIRKSLGCSDFHLIQGPPGTGKTYTIAAIVKKLLDEGKHIFISAPTHTAINNCLNSISKVVLDRSKIVKIGEKSQASEILSNENITRARRFTYFDYQNSPDFSRHGIVIGATPYALCYPASKKLQGWVFDCVIIDEAAQMSIPLALAAMTYGKKMIFVGDHKQLDPIMPSGTGNWLFAKSIFKHLVDMYPDNVTMLDKSYRLSESLVRIPSVMFYKGQLKTALYQDNKEFTRFTCGSDLLSCVSDILRVSSNEVLFLHHQFDALGRSPYEARLCSEIVLALVKNGVLLKDIAIMTPYRAQVREVKRELVRRHILDENFLDEVFVDTIERMQGQERDYVIFTLANSNPSEVEDRLEFFYSPNRLNVAITRAKTKCIVLANEKVFQLCAESNRKDAVSMGQKAYFDFYGMATKIYEQSHPDEEW